MKRLNILRHFLAPLSVLSHWRFHYLPPIVHYLSLLLDLLSCVCTLNIWVTSSLLIFLVGREGNHWVLATLPFIQGLWPYPIQWEWENVGVTYKIVEGLEYSNSFFSLGPDISQFNLLYGRILPSFHFILAKYNLWFIVDAYHHLAWWVRRFGYRF